MTGTSSFSRCPSPNPEDPDYVPGFSNYGAMSTPEGVDVSVPARQRVTLTLAAG